MNKPHFNLVQGDEGWPTFRVAMGVAHHLAIRNLCRYVVRKSPTTGRWLVQRDRP